MPNTGIAEHWINAKVVASQEWVGPIRIFARSLREALWLYEDRFGYCDKAMVWHTGDSISTHLVKDAGEWWPEDSLSIWKAERKGMVL